MLTVGGRCVELSGGRRCAEAYGYVLVGEYLKTPERAVWVVYSERRVARCLCVFSTPVRWGAKRRVRSTRPDSERSDNSSLSAKRRVQPPQVASCTQRTAGVNVCAWDPASYDSLVVHTADRRRKVCAWDPASHDSLVVHTADRRRKSVCM